MLLLQQQLLLLLLELLLPSGAATAAAAAVGTQSFYILFANQIESPTWPRVCQNGGVGPQGSECVAATKYNNGVIVTSPQNVTARRPTSRK